MNRRSNRPALRYTQGRLVYTMATFAAALVIVAFAVLTVPSLRSLTQTVYDQVFARPTQTEVIAVTVLPQQRSTGYILATAPLSSGFHVLGRVLHYDDFAVSLLDQAFTSYVNLMSSVSSDSVSS